MTPEERLQLITEEQKALRERLARLDASIAVLNAEMRASAPADIPRAQAPASSPIAVSRSTEAPPPLPKFAGGIPLESDVEDDIVPHAAPGIAPPREIPIVVNDEPPAVIAAGEANAAPTGPLPLPPRMPKQTSGDFEMRLGQVWFVRIGVVAILTGLVLGSVYAYKNRIHNAPPIVKVLALFLFSGALTGVGLWLERSRESLRTFGRVLAAGGLAALYYTTYAMHHVDRLRVIESPVVAGVLLLACALGIFIYADRREDVTVASMALVLGYYGTAINVLGWFSVFSNLVLTSGGLWLLWRRAWVSMGVLSLVGCYGGFAFWQYAFPLLTTGQLSPMPYWAGQAFLICCWVLFTAVFVFARAEVIPMVTRSALAAANCGGFFALYMIALVAKTPVGQRENPVAAYMLAWGFILLGLAWVSERYHGEKGKALGETFLACGLVQISVGLAVKLSGYQLGTIFAFQAALLAWFSVKQNRIVARVGAALLAASVLWISAQGLEDRLNAFTYGGTLAITWQQYLAALIQSVMLVMAGWFLRQPQLDTETRKISGLSAYFCILALLIFSFAFVLPVNTWTRLLVLLLVAAALLVTGSRKGLSFRELSLAGSIAALGALPMVLLQVFGYHRLLSADWQFNNITITVTALLMFGLAWLCKRQSWLKIEDVIFPGQFSGEAFLLSASALLSWVLVVLVALNEWWKSPTLLVICGALFLVGKAPVIQMPELALASRLGALVATAAIVIAAMHGAHAAAGPWDVLGALLNTLLLGGAAWLARHRPFMKVSASAVLSDYSLTAFYYSAAAAASFLFIVFLPLEGSWQPAGWIVFCAALVAAGKLAKINLPEISLCAGLAALAMTWVEIDDPQFGRNAELWLLLAFFVHAGASGLPAPGWSGSHARLLTLLRWAAGLQLTFAYVHWWHAHERELFPLATVVLGVLLAAVARWRQSGIAATFALIMLGLGLITFVAGFFGAPYPPQVWGWALPVLAGAGEWLLCHSQVYTEMQRLLLCRLYAVASVAAMWCYITLHVLAGGSYRTMAWAALAMVVFILGFLLKHATYRRCGLAVLALAIGRIVFYDVWQLDTIARFVSFLVIGGVLVALGFFYNRFEELIRKYL